VERGKKYKQGSYIILTAFMEQAEMKVECGNKTTFKSVMQDLSYKNLMLFSYDVVELANITDKHLQQHCCCVVCRTNISQSFDQLIQYIRPKKVPTSVSIYLPISRQWNDTKIVVTCIGD
jgi:hypothetical protein